MKDAASGAGRARKRATLACQACHQRKVRCNVIQSGPPCVNCLGDGIKCEIVARGRGIRRHRLVNMLAQQQKENSESRVAENKGPPNTNTTPSSSHVETRTEPSPGSTIAVSTSTVLCTQEAARQASSRSEVDTAPPESPGITSTQSTFGTGLDPEQRDGTVGYSAILDDDQIVERESDERTSFLYTGDQQGLGLVADICQPDRSRSNHFMIPRAAAMSSLLPEDLAALHAKGCFSLPSEKVREELLRSYFHHVHPFLPILEVASFISQYESGGPKKVNLLLLWSMFFASTNFLDEATVAVAGYPSRKAMKRSLYRRAKALYDADYEKDKIPLTQSVLLLAFWYADSEDRDGSWHWIGIAISLCQSIGLHRDPSVQCAGLGRAIVHRRRTPSARQCRLWRLVWWMCFFRDTWLSFGLGRPTRITLADCDTPIPTVLDVEALQSGMSQEHAEKYLPVDESRVLPRIWASLMETTFALSSILNNHYKAQPLEQHPLTLITHDDDRLRQCRSGFPTEEVCNDSVTLSHLYHLLIYYEACVIALHRPYMAGRPGEPPPSQDNTWAMPALHKVKIAASNINSTLVKINTSQLISSCHALMVTSMIPALQIHLLESVSRDPMARYLGRHHLDICMVMLGELRRTYWAADFIYSLFHKARRELDSRKLLQPTELPISPTDTTLPDSVDQNTCNRQPGIMVSNPMATPASTETASREEQAAHSLDINVPFDIDVALAYDVFPFQCDWVSGACDPENACFMPPTSESNNNGTSLNYDFSDADLNTIFNADEVAGFGA